MPTDNSRLHQKMHRQTGKSDGTILFEVEADTRFQRSTAFSCEIWLLRMMTPTIISMGSLSYQYVIRWNMYIKLEWRFIITNTYMDFPFSSNHPPHPLSSASARV
ncbi:hypothetical protein PILCRDRAFT_820010 [Piloderma croceum F 1598]|uniref:Uncharacterized protein n=1 Tax=Piloderma croceum (strain F 1598) TaxID=765440 RepID=A0A0C3B8V4_PILCF|nr:hypothetical protein PILCRDRAFT_820010 [Piloderma croceum F 1598]